MIPPTETISRLTLYRIRCYLEETDNPLWYDSIYVVSYGYMLRHHHEIGHTADIPYGRESFHRFRCEQVYVGSEERYDQPSTVFDVFIAHSLESALSRQVELRYDMKYYAGIFPSLVVVELELLGYERVNVHPLGCARLFECVQYAFNIVVLSSNSSKV